MCLIINRPDRKTEISAELIDSAIAQNGDGWGIVAALENELYVERGMHAPDFRRTLEAYGDLPLSIHFRWATHGSKDESNCHPFLINGGDYAVMHNGIIDTPVSVFPGRSDTLHFAELVLAPMLAARPELFGTEEFSDLIGALVGSGNKILIVRRDGLTQIINEKAGAFWRGLWLSNTNSLPGKGYAHLWRGRAAGSRYNWEEYADYFNGQYLPVNSKESKDSKETEEDTTIKIAPESPRAFRNVDNWADDLIEMAAWDSADIIDFVRTFPTQAAELIQEHMERYDWLGYLDPPERKEELDDIDAR